MAEGAAVVTPAAAQAAGEDGGGPAPGPSGEPEGTGPEGSVRGNYATSVKLEVPPFHRVESSLAIAYDSAAGNGWLGVGWKLAGLSFVRRTSAAKGSSKYDDGDTFLLDGQQLVP